MTRVAHYAAFVHARSTERAYVHAHAAGMLTGTFLDDVATNEIFALDTAGPPPPSSPPSSCPVIDYTRLFTQSIHRPIGWLFILDRASILIVPINESTWWPSGARTRCKSDRIVWSKYLARQYRRLSSVEATSFCRLIHVIADERDEMRRRYIYHIHISIT